MTECSIDQCHGKPVSRGWCRLHYGRWHRHGDPLRGAPTFEERLWSKVDASGPCWLWTGTLDPGRYGIIRTTQSAESQGVYRKAHRVVWELLVGPIAKGKQLDHLCKVRHCVNPDHLEPVTARVNTLRSASPSALNSRKTVCKQGHPFSGDNLYVTPKGWRQCRTCVRAAQARHREGVNT